MSAIGLLFGVFFLLCAVGALDLAPQEWSAAVLALIGSLSALVVLMSGALALVSDVSFRAELSPVLSLGTMTLAADRLSGLFLFITGLVFLPVSIYSGSYLANIRRVTACNISGCCITLSSRWLFLLLSRTMQFRS
jgi:formate hydrogenlyase subunit 3/multisubunit Na+/H+ antiporter MnhD subunit